MKGYIANKTLSASQIQTALKSKKQYIDIYFKGLESFGNRFTEFGNLVHENIKDLEVMEIPDWEIGKKFFIQKDGYNLMGYTDLEGDKIIEIKTCKKFDKKKYQFQCDFYRYCTGKEVELIMIETSEDGVGMFLTGNFERHTMEYSGDEHVEQQIQKAITKIHEYYDEYKSNKHITD